ncbi:MAG: sulfatase-like hydrolase/transferase [Cyclobacteriaceae bacterium]
MKTFSKVIFAVPLAVILTYCTPSKPPTPPNILFIYTDDQADWGLGRSGNAQIHTPNLDRLASEGAYLPNSFVTTPVCSPARVSLVTSQYASEHNVLDFIPQIGHRLYNPEVEIGLSPESITFPEVLKDSGYRTGLVGKWHVGIWTEEGSKKYHPTNHGYDYFMGLNGGGTTPVDPPLEVDGKMQQFKGLTTDILTDHAMDFIRNRDDRPFLLSLHYRAPHAKWLPVADEDWAPYEQLDPMIPNPAYPDLDIEKVKRKMKEYMASISGVDRNVGRVLNLLKELGIEEETIVIFTSDHGYNMGHNGIEHKGNGYWILNTEVPAQENLAKNSRPNMYDNSLKVPAIIKWPGVTKPGIVIEENFTSLDWYPTIVEMARSELPNEQPIRGKSLVPLLKAENVIWNNDIYSEYSMINYSNAYMRSYRTPEWKLVRDFLNPERDELYHISADPEENINLIHDPRPEVKDIIKKLHLKIVDKMQEIEDPLLSETKVDKYYYK